MPVITCDGTGVVSHAGTVLLAELADRMGLTEALSEATGGLRERRAGHDPGGVLVDVAVAIADGAVTISDVQALADQQGLHGPAGRPWAPAIPAPKHQRSLDELAMIAADLLALAQSLLLTTEPELHRTEPETLRYRLLHTAARITHGQRKVFLRLAEHWPWALALARAFQRLRTIPLPA